jgi:hypothetical protein
MIIDFRGLEIIFKIGLSQEVRGIFNFAGSVFQEVSQKPCPKCVRPF